MPLVNVIDTNMVLARELSFVINTTGTDPLHMMCVQDTFRHVANTTKQSAKTVCKPGREVNGPTTETITARILLTTGVDGSINRLVPLENTTVGFSWVYEGDVSVGPINPEFHGQLQVPPISLMDGDPNTPQYVDVEFPVDGRVLKNFTTTPVYAAHHGIL
jgi:hypothetical protein